MYSKIKLQYYIILLLTVLIASCGKEEKKEQVITKETSEVNIRKELSDFAKSKYGTNVKLFEYGYFDPDSNLGLIAGQEYSSKSAFGIKFYYLKTRDDKPVVDYETNLLDGSFEKSAVRKIKLVNKNYELLYYDSQDNFIGSGGGEVFSYIIDVPQHQLFYAHFFTVPEKPTSLYLSQNTTPEVRDFFLKMFQKDYPGVKLVDKDYNLEDIF